MYSYVSLVFQRATQPVKLAMVVSVRTVPHVLLVVVSVRKVAVGVSVPRGNILL